MSVAFIRHPSCTLHEMGRYHPERPERLDAIDELMVTSGLDAVVTHVDAPRATIEQLERVHDARYVARVLSAWADRTEPSSVYVRFDPDTLMNAHSAEAALRAAGAVARAVELVAAGEPPRAFCAVRPPGHHACHNRAMGFCFFNNIAVGTAHAIAELGIRRVAIVDFDVHHGNGTEDIVLRSWPWCVPADVSGGEVLFCSTFQHPFYPYSGADTEAANVVNVPLPAGTTGPAFRAALEEAWFPALDAFAPELVMVSAGFDGHADDDMAGWALRESDYVWATERICDVADRHCGSRLVSALEGGYETGALARCVVAHIRALLG